MSLTPAYGFGFDGRSLARALSLLEGEPELFASHAREEASLKLGLGTIKVEALARWASCAGLIERSDHGHKLSALARIVMLHDPQLEETGTWWLIHEGLTRGHEPWGWYTCEFATSQRLFSVAELDEGIRSAFQVGSDRAAKNARRAMVLAMTETPLGPDLGLMVEAGGGRFERRAAPADAVHPGIVACAILRWARMHKRWTASLDELLTDRGPALLFLYSRSALQAVLRRIQEAYRQSVLQLSTTAGLDSVTFGQNVLPLDLVEAYYVHQLGSQDPWEALRQALVRKGGSQPSGMETPGGGEDG